MEEFLGVIKVKGLSEIQYIKIFADDLDEANEKLDMYLEENEIDWTETEVVVILETID